MTLKEVLTEARIIGNNIVTNLEAWVPPADFLATIESQSTEETSNPLVTVLIDAMYDNDLLQQSQRLLALVAQLSTEDYVEYLQYQFGSNSPQRRAATILATKLQELGS